MTSKYAIDFTGTVSRTQQQFKSECCIHNILSQASRTGAFQHVNKAIAQYGDFTEVNEYRENLHKIQTANDAFLDLPSAVRRRFDNDPGKFFEFASDPSNLDELRKLGLAKPKPEDKPKLEDKPKPEDKSDDE